MKYLILGALLASAAIAAPTPAKGNNQGANANGGNNANANGNKAGAGAAKGQGAGNAGAATGATGAAGAAGGATGAATGAAGATGQTGTTQPAAGSPGTTTPGTNSAVPPPPGGAAGQTPTAGDLATAVANWQADTSMVSMFLNNGASINDDAAFKQAALVAFNAEVDELTHKAVIDAANGQMPNVQAANSTLATGGAFQDVVDKLQIMSQQGKAAANNIDLINQNRCTNVLPNIDAYMASTGSNSQAIRPNVCDQTGVKGGVQSNGPTLPGQTPVRFLPLTFSQAAHRL